jgi:chromatin segregation and condensation protein Rec8/ScpA/Scc1 (kleisin family)
MKYKGREAEYGRIWKRNKYKTDPEFREKLKKKVKEYEKKNNFCPAFVKLKNARKKLSNLKDREKRYEKELAKIHRQQIAKVKLIKEYKKLWERWKNERS